MSRVVFDLPMEGDAGPWCPVCAMAMMERIHRELDKEIKKAQDRESGTPVFIKIVPQIGELMVGEVYALAPGLESFGLMYVCWGHCGGLSLEGKPSGGGLYQAGPGAIGVPGAFKRGRG